MAEAEGSTVSNVFIRVLYKMRMQVRPLLENEFR